MVNTIFGGILIMKKTLKLNKFLSYIHMGNSVYRVFYDKAKEVNSKELLNIICRTEEVFKTHEETISSKVIKQGFTPTKRLTIQAKFAIWMEKMKVMDTPFKLCQSMIKATNMGMLQVIKFLHENKELSHSDKDVVKDIIDDYQKVIKNINSYIISVE